MTKQTDRAVWVEIRRSEDGAVRQFADIAWFDADPDGRGETFNDFMWADGNYACDCNRELFWLRAGGEAREDSLERASCGDGRYQVRIWDQFHQDVLYSDWI